MVRMIQDGCTETISRVQQAMAVATMATDLTQVTMEVTGNDGDETTRRFIILFNNDNDDDNNLNFSLTSIKILLTF